MYFLTGTYDRIFASCCMWTWISGARSEPDQLWVATSLCSLFSVQHLYGGEERAGWCRLQRVDQVSSFSAEPEPELICHAVAAGHAVAVRQPPAATGSKSFH